MRKFFAVLLALCVCLSSLCALAESNATPAEPQLSEGEILMHGYKSENAGYYVGVPAEWALVGASSLAAHLEQAYEIAGYSEVKSLHASLSAENDILFAFSASGEQMILTYGLSEGVDSDKLIDEMDSFKRILASQYTGITFTDDCGAYNYKEIYNVLYIGAKYNGNKISQYFLPGGDSIYVFTFCNVEKSIEEVVISNFNLSAAN